MYDYEREVFESAPRPISAKQAIDFCLDALFADKDHETTDMVVSGLNFEELIGALVQAKKELMNSNKQEYFEEFEQW